MTRAELIKRLGKATKSDNALDVLVEIALFEPDETFVAVRANAAGTKVIYTRPDGREQTFWAPDWTMDHTKAIALLRAEGETP